MELPPSAFLPVLPAQPERGKADRHAERLVDHQGRHDNPTVMFAVTLSALSGLSMAELTSSTQESDGDGSRAGGTIEEPECIVARLPLAMWGPTGEMLFCFEKKSQRTSAHRRS